MKTCFEKPYVKHISPNDIKFSRIYVLTQLDNSHSFCGPHVVIEKNELIVIYLANVFRGRLNAH